MFRPLYFLFLSQFKFQKKVNEYCSLGVMWCLEKKTNTGLLTLLVVFFFFKSKMFAIWYLHILFLQCMVYNMRVFKTQSLRFSLIFVIVDFSVPTIP